MIKAVLMDIDNTLLDFNKCAEYAIRCAFEEYSLEYTDEVLRVFFVINTMLWNDIEKGVLDKDGLYRIRWKNIFAELGIDRDGADFEKYFLKYLSCSYQKVNGADDILKYLSGRYMICAASNGPHTEQMNRLKNAGIVNYFDNVFTSESIGYQKPREEFFCGCLKKMDGILPQETIIIGDSQTADISGGKKSGLVTCLFNYERKKLNSFVDADYVIESLDEIKNIL